MANSQEDRPLCSKEEFKPKQFLLYYNNPPGFCKISVLWVGTVSVLAGFLGVVPRGMDHPYRRVQLAGAGNNPAQQCCGSVPYLFWRVFWALYHVLWIILTGVYSWQWAGNDPAQQVKWFIYLTDWCYFILTIAVLTDVATVLYIFFARKDILNGTCVSMTWYLKTNWVLFNVANSSALMVSISYWALQYDPTKAITAVDIVTHALNAVYVLANVVVTTVPVRFYHFFHGIVFGVTYVIFTLIYYAAEGTNEVGKRYIYTTMDWSKPGTTVGMCVAIVFVGLPICHFIFFGIFCLRRLISYKCCVHPNTGSSYNLDQMKS